MYTSDFKTREKNRLAKDFAVEKASVKSKTEGIAIGETRGKTAKAEEIAMKLYEIGIKQSIIYKTTGVSAKRIFQLRNENGRLIGD
jgi:hypothetical protein